MNYQKERPAALVPRGLRRPDAAAYEGVSPTKFDEWASRGIMPDPEPRWPVLGLLRFRRKIAQLRHGLGIELLNQRDNQIDHAVEIGHVHHTVMIVQGDAAAILQHGCDSQETNILK